MTSRDSAAARSALVILLAVAALSVPAPAAGADPTGGEGPDSLASYKEKYGAQCGPALWKDEQNSAIPAGLEGAYEDAVARLKKKGFPIILPEPTRGAVIGLKDVVITDDSRLGMDVELSGEGDGVLRAQLGDPAGLGAFVEPSKGCGPDLSYAVLKLRLKAKIITVEAGALSVASRATFDLPLTLHMNMRATGTLVPCETEGCPAFARFDLHHKFCLGEGTRIPVELAMNTAVGGLLKFVKNAKIAAAVTHGLGGAVGTALDLLVMKKVRELVEVKVGCLLSHRLPVMVRAVTEGEPWEKVVFRLAFEGTSAPVESLGDVVSKSVLKLDTDLNLRRVQDYVSAHFLHQPDATTQWDMFIQSMAESGLMAIEPVLLTALRERLHHKWSLDLNGLAILVENVRGAATMGRGGFVGPLRVAVDVDRVRAEISEGKPAIAVPVGWSLAHLARMRRLREVREFCVVQQPEDPDGCYRAAEADVDMPTVAPGAEYTVKRFAGLLGRLAGGDPVPSGILGGEVAGDQEMAGALAGVHFDMELRSQALKTIRLSVCGNDQDRACVIRFQRALEYLSSAVLAVECAGSGTAAATRAGITLQCRNRVSLNINGLADEINRMKEPEAGRDSAIQPPVNILNAQGPRKGNAGTGRVRPVPAAPKL